MPRKSPLEIPFPSPTVLCGLLWVAVVGLAFQFYGPAFQSGANDALDYAAMGRNLARGEGFTTATLYPLQLSEGLGLRSREDFDPRKVPNLHRPPLLPLIYSVAYRVFGESTLLFPSVSFLFYLILLSLVWYSSSPAPHLPGTESDLTRKVSFRATAVAVIALFPPLVRQIPAGLAEIPAAVVCLAVTILLSSNRRNAGRVFAMGLLTGAGFLFKSYLLILLLALAVFFWGEREKRGRWRNIALLSLGWLVISGPWLFRNWIVAGNPFFTLQAYCEISKGIPGYEAFRAHRSLEPVSTWSFVRNHPGELWVKSISSLVVSARSDVGANLAVLALGLIVWRQSRKGELETRGPSRVLVLLLLVNVCIAILLAPINLEPRYLLPTLLPLLVLSLIGTAGRTKRGLHERYLVSLLVLFSVINLIGFSRAERTPDRREDGPFLSSRIPADGLVLTDADSFVAWFADRPALWLPSDEEALERILESFPVLAVYLQGGLRSPYFAHYSSPEAALNRLRERFGSFEQTPSGAIFLH